MSEQNYHTPFFSEILLAIKLKKKQIHMNKPAISILKLKQIVIYEVSYDYIKPK